MRASATWNSSSRHRRSRHPRRGRPAAPEAGGSSIVDQLNQLAGLHQQGVLTDDEFAAAKAKLIGS